MTSEPITGGIAQPAPMEARLVQRAAAGDDDAFERLVRLHERRVYSIARRLLGDPADAEDAAQETFLRLYRALHRLRPERPVAPYLNHIAVNVCRDFGRRRGRRREQPLEPVLPGEPSSGDPPDPRADPATDAATAELRRHAAAALESLPFKQRAALVLRELHGLSTRQVAAALGATETTVRSHVSRARLALRERLAALECSFERTGGTDAPQEEIP